MTVMQQMVYQVTAGTGMGMALTIATLLGLLIPILMKIKAGISPDVSKIAWIAGATAIILWIASSLTLTGITSTVMQLVMNAMIGYMIGSVFVYILSEAQEVTKK